MAADDDDRGKIRNVARAQQLKDLSGLRWGNITPTDIDISVDFGHGRSFVIADLKVMGADLSGGQRKHYESLVDSVIESGRRAIAIIADHATRPEEVVDAASCPVRCVYHGKGQGWAQASETITLRSYVDALRKVWGED